GLRFERFGETELLDPLGDVLAAAPARVADRLRGQERCPIVLDRTDVRFWRAGAHRDAKTGEHVGRYRGGHDLVLLGEIVHRLRTKRNQVGRTAAGPLLERVPGLLEHRYLVAARARKAGSKFARAWHRALVGQNNEFGGVWHTRAADHCARQDAGSGGALHPSSHRVPQSCFALRSSLCRVADAAQGRQAAISRMLRSSADCRSKPTPGRSESRKQPSSSTASSGKPPNSPNTPG